MHIGLYSPAWPANEFPNGIVTYVHTLRRELLKQGHRVSVFPNRVGATNTDPGIHSVGPGRTRRMVWKLKSLLGIRQEDESIYSWHREIAATINRVHRADPLDVVEMEEFWGWCAGVKKLVPIPVVVKLHGPAFLTLIEELRQTKNALGRIEMEGWGLRQMDTIISPSRNTLRSTIERYDLTPPLCRTIPNPITIEDNIGYWGLGDCDKKTILFVGRFDKLKGGDIALRAFRNLLEMDDSLKLIFVGPDRGLACADGSSLSFQDYSKSLFSKAQHSRIAYLGQIPRAKIFDLRKTAILTLVTSRWENQPNTALEAMIQGCPVVAFDTGGMNEIIEDGVTGLLARPDDLGDLCRKIMAAMADPEKARQMGENGRRFVTERHSASKLAKDTLEVYREAIAMAEKRSAANS